jgi:cellulose synthase/poly-beta-1,6-N-acetylglucosamine synthase-like glycosyltransferase
MRLVKQGYRTAILDSTTLEEANSDFKNWFWQRSRWIKGYMQSYFVHLRDIREFMYDWRQPHGLTFQLIVGGKVLSMLINPIMWLIVVIYFVFRPILGSFIDSFFPTPVFYMAIFSLVFGNALYLYYYMVGNAKRGNEELVKFGLLVPLYWLAMSAAAYMAVYKLITAPHHWSKTKHGLHLTSKKGLAQTQERIGNYTNHELIAQEPYSQNLI